MLIIIRAQPLAADAGGRSQRDLSAVFTASVPFLEEVSHKYRTTIIPLTEPEDVCAAVGFWGEWNYTVILLTCRWTCVCSAVHAPNTTLGLSSVKYKAVFDMRHVGRRCPLQCGDALTHYVGKFRAHSCVIECRKWVIAKKKRWLLKQ